MHCAIVDDHNDIIPFLFACWRSKKVFRISDSDINCSVSVLHFDAHPDLSLPLSNSQHSQHTQPIEYNKNSFSSWNNPVELIDTLSSRQEGVAEFLIPLFTNHLIDQICWIRPCSGDNTTTDINNTVDINNIKAIDLSDYDDNKQLPNGSVVFQISDSYFSPLRDGNCHENERGNNDYKLQFIPPSVNLRCPYYLDDGSYSVQAFNNDISPVNQVTVKLLTCNTNQTLKMNINYDNLTIDDNQPFFYLVDMKDDIKPDNDEVCNIRNKSLQIINKTILHYDESNYQHFLSELLPLYESDMAFIVHQLLSLLPLLSNSTRELIVHANLCLLLPQNNCTEQQIINSIENMKQFLMNLPKEKPPSVITLARSSDFISSTNDIIVYGHNQYYSKVDFIQSQVIDMLEELAGPEHWNLPFIHNNSVNNSNNNNNNNNHQRIIIHDLTDDCEQKSYFLFISGNYMKSDDLPSFSLKSDSIDNNDENDDESDNDCPVVKKMK
eukprot:gene10844-14557_t